MTIRDIAKKTGVSIASVSRVLNNHPRVSDELRSRVLESVQSQRYVPSVGRRNTSNIAYAYTGDVSLGSPFDSAVLDGLYGAMADSNFNMMLLDLRRTRRNCEDYSQMFQRLGVRGAVLRTTYGTRSSCESIIDQDFPSVVVGDRPPIAESLSVYCESRSASREAVAYLVSLGHRRIAISSNLVDDTDHQDRLAGYREAHHDHGLDIDDSLIIRATGDRQGGYQLIRRIIAAANRPTAIYITDPMTAVSAMIEAHKMGLRIPKDLSIIGFDDADLRHTVLPTMTAVCQDATEIGRDAYRVLSERLKTKNTTSYSPPAAWLEIHGSAGPVPDIR